MRAEVVLGDCRTALTMLEESTDEQLFRILWVGLIASLRAVGHVLDKVDAASDPVLRLAVDSKWAEWKVNRGGNAIFWEFIEAERNNMLKAYESNWLPGDVDVVNQNGSVNEGFTLDEMLFTPLLNGRYAGEDVRDIVQEAILWWSQQFADINQAYEENGIGSG